MNGERVSLKELPLQEGEPCLNHEYQSTQDYDESYHTNLSTTISERTTDHVGRCILVLLIIAIFIFAVIIAFVIGHWIAQPEIGPYDQVVPKENVKDPHSIELNDIYPPSSLYTPNEIFHYTSKAYIKKHRKVLLNPIPENIFPIHYSIQEDSKAGTDVISFTTNFEPTLARTFFPCWDEPQIKATFNISVIHSRTVTVLSNTAPQRILSDDPDRDTILTAFHQTPPMSAYLVAFAVGPFTSIESRTSRNLPLKIWTFADSLASAKFASNFSPLMFDKLEQEFKVSYPFSKLDFVAARSFPVGGMENWGLVIYHDNMLLLNSYFEDNNNLTVDLLDLRYGIEKIVTHELTHQWFGNLVTLNNWSEIWLNEGFASFYVYDALRKAHPYLTDIEYYLYLAQLQNKQTSDEKMSLVKLMRNEAEVEKAFDRFHMYTKGCVIIEMIKSLVGDRQFRLSVQRYLKNNAFKAVGREALWVAMPNHVKFGGDQQSLEEIIEPWLVNSGMPEVIISRNYHDKTVRISQRTSDQNRYIIFLNNHEEGKSQKKKSWPDYEQPAETSKYGNKKTRKNRSLFPLEAPSSETRLPDGSIPFDESLFDDVTSIAPLGDDHIPTQSEEIVNVLLKKQEQRKGKRIKPKKETKIRNPVENKLNLKSTIEFYSRTKFRRSQKKKQYWIIPFSYQLPTSSNDKSKKANIKRFFLRNETLTFEDSDVKNNMPLLANPNWTYPIRVNYDLTNWKLLIQLLNENHHHIPSKSRIQLICDAEFYLKQSGVPELYASLLKYLSKETDLGVLLHGLDAVYRFADLVKGIQINQKVFSSLSTVVEQIDKVFNESRANPEKAAVWLIDPDRLIQLYQLRCATNLATCEEEKQVNKWVLASGISESDYYLQIAAVCNHLFNGATRRELQIIIDGLKHFTGKWSENLQLAICVQHEEILLKAVEHIVNTKNAAIYTAALQNDHFLCYNLKFRKLFWSAIGAMPLEERKMLFSAKTKDSFHVGRVLVHSVRSESELYFLKSIMPNWSYHMQMHLQYVENKLKWLNTVVAPRLDKYLKEI
uniref:Peptidase_M1 domain-containing protein n=1 Tax=Syphacia muris TaxID=451379 RepID=A0A0N5AKQ4_9BILA